MNFAHECLSVPSLIKESMKENKKVKSICGCAMLTALNVSVGALYIPISPTIRIGFSSVFAGVSGMVYGPMLTGFAGDRRYIKVYDPPRWSLFSWLCH